MYEIFEMTNAYADYSIIRIDNDGNVVIYPESNEYVVYTIDGTDIEATSDDDRFADNVTNTIKNLGILPKNTVVKIRTYNIRTENGTTYIKEYTKQRGRTVLNDPLYNCTLSIEADTPSNKIFRLSCDKYEDYFIGTLYIECYTNENLDCTIKYTTYSSIFRSSLYGNITQEAIDYRRIRITSTDQTYKVYYKYGDYISNIVTINSNYSTDVQITQDDNNIYIVASNPEVEAYDEKGIKYNNKISSWQTAYDTLFIYNGFINEKFSWRIEPGNTIYTLKYRIARTYYNEDLTDIDFYLPDNDNYIQKDYTDWNTWYNNKILEAPTFRSYTTDIIFLKYIDSNKFCSDKVLAYYTFDGTDPIENSPTKFINNSDTSFGLLDISNIEYNIPLKARTIVKDENGNIVYGNIGQLIITEFNILPAPIITSNNNNVYITSDLYWYVDFHYTIDGNNPTNNSNIYTNTFVLLNSCIIKAIAIRGNFYSPISSYNFIYYEYTEVGSKIVTTGAENAKLVSPIIKNYLDILFSKAYEVPQVLESIQYVLNEIENDNTIYNPTEEQLNRRFSGDSMEIYSDETKTGELNINCDDGHNKLNDYKYPHWDKGKWNFNYFRNTVGTTTKPTDSDNQSVIYGKYFVVRFIFNNDRKFKLETVEPKINVY